MSIKKDLRIINPDTGEIIPNEYFYIRTKEEYEASKEYFRNKEAREALREFKGGRSRKFTNSDMNNLSEVYEHLTLAQSGLVLVLQAYIGWVDGILVNPDKSPMTYRDIRKALGMEERKPSFSLFMKAVQEAGIIREIVPYEKYAVNDRYHFVGSFDKRKVVKTYSRALRRSYEELRAEDLGIVYRLLPYISMKHNAVCHNPYETDPDEIEWMTMKEMATAANVSYSTVKRRVPRMTIDGEYVFLRHSLGGGRSRYSVNPEIIDRNDAGFSEDFRNLFRRGI